MSVHKRADRQMDKHKKNNRAGPMIRVRNWKLFFLILNKNICCGYSKEPSRWDGSFEHPKHMFKLMDKKIITILRNLFLHNWLYDRAMPTFLGKALIYHACPLSIMSSFIKLILFSTATYPVWTCASSILVWKWILTDPVITQFFLATNLAFLTGRSHTSNDLISCWNTHIYVRLSPRNLRYSSQNFIKYMYLWNTLPLEHLQSPTLKFVAHTHTEPSPPPQNI